MNGFGLAVCATGALFIQNAQVRAATFWPETAQPVARVGLKGLKILKLPGSRERYIQIGDQLFAERTALLSGFSGTKWPGGKLVYKFDSGVDNAKQLVFLTSCNLWGAVASVSCVARTNETDYVVVRSGSENSATIGKPTGVGRITIFNWNSSLIIAHEIGHSLGLAHEHCRSDRDTYVKILLENVIAGKEDNFDLASTDNVGTSYDFDSVMHYGGTSFGTKDPVTSKAMMTIEVLPPNQAKQSTIGQRTRLSATDAAGMAARYGRP